MPNVKPSGHHQTQRSFPTLAAVQPAQATDVRNVPNPCAEVIEPSALFGRLMQQTTGHLRADVHFRPTTHLALPSGPAVRVSMPPKPRGTLLLDFENDDGKLRLTAGSFEFKERLLIKRLGDLSGAHGVRRFVANKLARYEVTGFKIDGHGTITPQGTVVVGRRVAVHRFDKLIPSINLNTLAHTGDMENGLSKQTYKGIQSALRTISSGSFKFDTKSRLGEDVLLDASKVALGNETYVGLARTAISGDVQGHFQTHGDGVQIELYPPKRACDRTISCNTAEVDLHASLEARLEKRRRTQVEKGQHANVLGVAIYATDAVANVRHLDLGLRGEPSAVTNSGRVVGGTAWHPCGPQSAVVVSLEQLDAFIPSIAAMHTRGRIDADAALSLVEPVDPDNVLAASTRGLQLSYDGKLDALGDITFTQPSGDPTVPPARMIQRVKYERGVNKSGDMEPIEDAPPGP